MFILFVSISNIRRPFPQINADVQMTNSGQCGGSGPLLRARGCEGNSTSFNGTDKW